MKTIGSYSIPTGFALAAATWMPSGNAQAAQPEPWQVWFQNPASQHMADIEWFGIYTFAFIAPILLLVTALLAWILIRYRERVNPTPTKTSHNVTLEILWTGIPVLILVAIAIPSFNLLNREYFPEEEPELTIKATGSQWYWSYEYQDENELSFDSLMLEETDRAGLGKTDRKAYPRLLAVDNEVVVPVDSMIRVLVTASDVIHSFTIPSFGFKIDAVPGRLNETWFKAEREGIHYGQCSELCGRNHAFMPIAVRVVSRSQYEAWRKAAQDDLDRANQALASALGESGSGDSLAARDSAPESALESALIDSAPSKSTLNDFVPSGSAPNDSAPNESALESALSESAPVGSGDSLAPSDSLRLAEADGAE